MKNKILLFSFLSLFGFQNQAQTVSDYEGNSYNVITIGSQKWLKENLRSTRFKDGTAISLITDSAAWGNLSTEGYCWYMNDSATYSQYGIYYNWFTVATNKLCPVGWHVSTDAEWTTLTNYLGGEAIAGGKLKETTTLHWTPPNVGATNQTGFTAIANGYRHGSGYYDNLLHNSYFWTATAHISGNSWERSLCHDTINVLAEYFGRNTGMAVRCVMDTITAVNEIKQEQQIKIYPNPATGMIYIECEGIKGLVMQMYNMKGEAVLSKALLPAMNKIEIDAIAKGSYLIRCSGKDKSFEEKILIR
jgi:uncharacterized protein (TIGR02145 family)